MIYIIIICACVFILLLLFYLVLIITYIVEGGPQTEGLDSEIYEIDYRGPETHSFVPPPDHSLGDHSKTAAAAKTMGLTGSDPIMKQKASIN